MTAAYNVMIKRRVHLMKLKERRHFHGDISGFQPQFINREHAKPRREATGACPAVQGVQPNGGKSGNRLAPAWSVSSHTEFGRASGLDYREAD